MFAVFNGLAPHESLKGIIVTIISNQTNAEGETVGYRVKRDDGESIYGKITEWFSPQFFFLSLPCEKTEKKV